MTRRFGWAVAPAVAIAAVAAGAARAETATIAVATNFARPLEALAPAFAAASGHTIAMAAASTGQLYAQIRQGAPFDVFLAADAERPAALVAEGAAVAASRFAYAYGRLVLLSRSPAATGEDCLEFLRAGGGHIAIANPTIAPYGRAARETLEALGLWPEVAGRIVQGNDVGQTFAFVATANAEAGFVALSQVIAAADPAGPGCRWDVPAGLHAPIEQQAVLLVHGAGNAAALAFLTFMRSAEAQATIRAFGYGTTP
ncbi:MAG: molybdate ABC transporter substrate-binding protein [Alphaproteobacteria bacterium]